MVFLVGIALVGLGAGLAAAWYAMQIHAVTRAALRLARLLRTQWDEARADRAALRADLAAVKGSRAGGERP